MVQLIFANPLDDGDYHGLVNTNSESVREEYRSHDPRDRPRYEHDSDEHYWLSDTAHSCFSNSQYVLTWDGDTRNWTIHTDDHGAAILFKLTWM